MEKRTKDKTRSSGRNMTITSVFRVKKCLFDSTQTEFTSPKPLSPLSSISPNVDSSDESPFSLFRVRKRRSEVSSMRAEFVSVSSVNYETPQKRITDDQSENKENSPFSSNVDMLSPESSNSVKLAVQKASLIPNLIGDFSKPCVLPLICGKHPDLMAISPEIVAEFLPRHDALEFVIVDCRYPYEFEGGHIVSAINIFEKDVAEKDFFHSIDLDEMKNRILIFYCEFSSERAPSMIRFLRGKDRDMNKNRYPHLHYPEMYLIEGGYSAFFSSFKDLCNPPEYKTMLDKDCANDLTYYRSRSRMWKKNSKQAKRVRSTLKF